ncbi:hypothetical protein BSKO_03002 [Bryopsis sp. KO-2023]|nr:hypothetical protein BSKO_03002 [Bryopsis sp. KO-2023]
MLAELETRDTRNGRIILSSKPAFSLAPMAETSKSGAKRRTRRRLKKANKALVEASTGCGAFMWMHYNLGTSFHAGCNPALRSSLEGRNFVSRLVEVEARLHQEGLQATGLEVLEAFLRGHAGEEASNGGGG